jgi:hypothetical protein
MTSNRASANARRRMEMARLVTSTVDALEHANLLDEIQLLNQRVFNQDVSHIFEIEADPNHDTLAFKPYVELLLRHVRGIAADRERSLDERRLDIRRCIAYAGF